MKSRSGEKIKLTSIDELLGVVNEESAMEIEINRIHAFKDHPFKVLDDEKMADLVESVKTYGVLTPVLLRSDGENGYEMISGHRRMHAAVIAGLATIPAIVRDLSDDDAVIASIGWIVADNVVVTFDIFAFLIFVKMIICQFTFLVKRHRITVQAIHIKLFSQDASSGFIYNLFPGFFIMFKQKIIDSSRVICISAFNVFYDCHSYHLPVSVLLFSIGISR